MEQQTRPETAYRPEGMLLGCPQNIEAISSRRGLERAMLNGTVLEAIATLCDGDMNLHVDLGEIHGIVRREESALNPGKEEIRDIAIITRVGKPIAFKVLSIGEENGKTVAYLSRKAAQADCLRHYVSDLIPGDILPARVTHLESFGAFVDIGCGIVSLLSVDCLSVSRIPHPRDRLSAGMAIWVVLKSIDHENRRYFVSQRELLGTWEQNASLFAPGQTVPGIIRSVEPYGAFIELTPNLAGLAELRDNGKIDPALLVGKSATVYIKSILPERMKVKLVLVDVFDTVKVPPRISYFVDAGKTLHLDRWVYSPAQSSRLIESVFNEKP